jgi:hypothetical protein
MSALGRLCSLIPGFGVKLSANILAGPTVAEIGDARGRDGGVREEPATRDAVSERFPYEPLTSLRVSRNQCGLVSDPQQLERCHVTA